MIKSIASVACIAGVSAISISAREGMESSFDDAVSTLNSQDTSYVRFYF